MKKGASTALLSGVSESSLLRLNYFGIGEEDATRVDDVAVVVDLRADVCAPRDAVSPIGFDHVVFSAGRTPGDAGREVERSEERRVGREGRDGRWHQHWRQMGLRDGGG